MAQGLIVQLGQPAALLLVFPKSYRQNRELRLKRQTGRIGGSETGTVRRRFESRIGKPAEFGDIWRRNPMLSI